jgi:hypothetical protein
MHVFRIFAWLIIFLALLSFQVSLHNNILKVGRGHVFGSDEIMSARVPRVTGVADLFVGFGAWDKPVTFKYYGPSLSCVHSEVPDFDPTPTPTRNPPATPTPCEVRFVLVSVSHAVH